MRKLLLGAAALSVVAAASWATASPHKATATATASASAAVSLDAPRFGAWGFDLGGMDRSVNPGDNFYDYANGGWDKVTEVPPDRARFGNFDKLTVLSEARTNAILSDAVAGRITGDADAAKIAAAYTSFMDEARIEALGAKPLTPQLDAIRAAKTRDDLTALMGEANTAGYASIFDFGISDDLKNPQHYAVYARQSGLGMPDRDYYLKPDFADKKAAYQAYVGQILTLIGWPDAAGEAKAVVDYETKLAEVYWSRVQLRDRDRIYNPLDRAGLKALAPGTASWPKTA
jgi:putative endopeptidase